jgi:hypothetical protein
VRMRWTTAGILHLSHTYGCPFPGVHLLQTVHGATSAHGSCKPCAARPGRTAAHFFPHTRPPDTHPHFLPKHTAHTTFTHSIDNGDVSLKYPGSLVNTYFSLVLSSMSGNKQRGRRMPHRPHPGPAAVRPRARDNTLDETSDIGSVDGARDMSMSFAREGSGGFDSSRHDRDPSPSPAPGAASGGFGSGRHNGTSSPSPAASGGGAGGFERDTATLRNAAASGRKQTSPLTKLSASAACNGTKTFRVISTSSTSSDSNSAGC